MAKEKNAKDIGEILAEQLDSLRSAEVDDFAIKKADAITNIIGKLSKMAALEMQYADAAKRPVPTLPSLTR